MGLFANKARTVQAEPAPKRARKLTAVASPEYVTREHFDAVVDSLLELICEAGRAPSSGGRSHETLEFRFDRHTDSPIAKRAERALTRVREADQRVQNEWEKRRGC